MGHQETPNIEGGRQTLVGVIVPLGRTGTKLPSCEARPIDNGRQENCNLSSLRFWVLASSKLA